VTCYIEHAERVVRAIMGACHGLAQFPLLGRIGKVEGTRERPMTRYPYRIDYHIADETIVVARIVGQRQQWPPVDSEE
jgi:toxin ParE1/3/4